MGRSCWFVVSASARSICIACIGLNRKKGLMDRKNQVMSRYESDFVCLDCRDGGFEDSPPMTRRRNERRGEE